MTHPLMSYTDGLTPQATSLPTLALWAAGLVAVVLSAAIFGFFYAWVCSTMWGLDAAPPQVAVQAMQAMNASVRNAVFAPAFFGTPLALALAAALCFAAGRGPAGALFTAAAALYLALAFVPTLAGNVPMNEALAAAGVPATEAQAAELWAAYSPKWQLLNQLRTAASGGVLILAALGLRAL